MNSYFTRSQQQILESTPNYNTRLQSRVRNIINDNLNKSNQTMRADIRNEFQFVQNSVVDNFPNNGNNINIDFDEASRAWNANKRKVGQSYEYVNGMTTRSRSRAQND